MTIENILFIVGSPKARNSSSEALGTYVVDQLVDARLKTRTAHVNKIFRTAKFTEEFLTAYDHADVVLLAYPLYVDTLPYLVTRTMEAIAAHRTQHPAPKPQRIACIGNCGFPEADHLSLSLEICQEFAREVGLEWLGGLAIGEGGAIDGEAVGTIRGRLRNQIAALDMLATAILSDASLPTEAVALAARPIIPQRLYTFMGTVGWNWMAHQNEVRHDLHAAPYARVDG